MYRDILALFILIVLTIPVSYRLNVSRSRAMVVVMGLIMTFGYMGGGYSGMYFMELQYSL